MPEYVSGDAQRLLPTTYFSNLPTRSTLGMLYPEPTAASAVAEASAPNTDSVSPPRHERRRRGVRWRKWLILCLALLTLRFGLPLAVAPLVSSRLSRALGTRVEIGGLTVQPIDAIFTLRDVTVHAPGGGGDSTPPIVAERVRIDVQWLPLLHQTFRVRELALESARVDVDRLSDGRFRLADLERADPASELPAGWSFELDRVALRDSDLRVRDLAAGGSAFLEATLREADISGMRRRATAFGKPTNLRVDALVGGGRLRVDGNYELRDDGLGLDARVRVKDVSLAQVKSYVVGFGWTDVAGRLSGQLRWRREPRRRDVLSGRLNLRRGRVGVSDLREPALEVWRAIADVSAIDLLERRIAIRSLTLHGATLALRADPGAPVPLLTAAISQPSRAGRPSDAPARGIQSAPQWRWMIEHLVSEQSRLRVFVPGGRFDLRTQASGENLSPGSYWSPLRIAVAHHGAAAAFDGTIRLTHGVALEGKLTAAGLDIAGLARAARVPWGELIEASPATADLAIELDTAATEGPPLYARGTIGLTDLWVVGPHPNAFAFGAAAVDLTLEDFSLRESDAAHDRDGQARQARIHFSSATARAPFVLLMRQADGWLLPPSAPEETMPDAVPAAEHPEPVRAEMVIDVVRAVDGRLTIVDLVPTPGAIWDLMRVEAVARGVSLPGLAFDRIELHGADRKFGDLQVAGSRGAGMTSFEASSQGLSLTAANPYLRLARFPYGFASGRGSFTASGWIAGAGWSADTVLKLQEPALAGSETSLEQAIGMPVPTALDLLRDPAGDVTLQLALGSPGSGGRDVSAERVAAAVRDAIHGVRTAELADFTPLRVLFRPGQVELNGLALQELARVGELLRSRSSVVVEVSAETSDQDRRWLAEQALYRKMHERGGFRGVLRALGMRDARDRIRAALAARAEGAPGLLDPEDEALLSRLLAQEPEIDDARLVTLGEARLRQVVNHLAARYGTTGERVVMRAVSTEHRAGPSAVRVEVSVGSGPAIVVHDVPGPDPAVSPESIRSERSD